MARELLESGRYGSLGEVVRVGLRALERPRIESGVTEEAPGAILKARVEQALADPAPSIPQAGVFASRRAHRAGRSAKPNSA